MLKISNCVAQRWSYGFFAAILSLILAFGVASKVEASGTFIAAPGRVDHIHDTKRNLIYISSAHSILRFDVATSAFLPPIALGGALGGLDISPDGNTLAVANRTPSESEDTNSIFLVDLPTGAPRTVSFVREFGEGGTWTVAYGGDGRLLILSDYQGSGWVPLRRYDAATGETVDLTPGYFSQITNRSMLCASGDGSVVGIAEADISDGAWGTYRVSDGALVKRQGYTDGTSWFNYEIGVNNNGSQFSIPTYGGTFVYDANYQKIATIGVYAAGQPVGVAYHPTKPKIYFPWANTGEVRVYDADSFQHIASYDFETEFGFNSNRAFVNGRTKISRDGSLLAVSVAGGVRFLSIEALTARSQSLAVNAGVSTDITLAADNSVFAVPVSFSVVSLPTHGTLTGSAPNLVYTANANFSGADSFEFQVSDGLQISKAKVAITVKPRDVSGPVLEIRTPAEHQVVASLPQIAGTVSDQSEIASVKLSLRRDEDGIYWNGFAWGTQAPVLLPAKLHNGFWWNDFGMPFPTASEAAKLKNGAYTITASAADRAGNATELKRSFSVAPPNYAPLAVDDALEAREDTPLVIAASSLLKNDFNGERAGAIDALKIIAVNANEGFSGTLQLDVARQIIIFRPALNRNGATNFTYVIEDSGKATSHAVVALQIAPVNDAPVAFRSKMTVIGTTPGEIELGGEDIDSDILGFALRLKPANGSAQIIKVGEKWMLRYAAKSGFSGTDVLLFAARDAKLWSLSTPISIEVRANRAPQIVGLSPRSGTFAAGSTLIFEQKVRDHDGASHLDAVALVVSNSPVKADARGGAAMWFDAQTNRFTLSRDDAQTTLLPVPLGKTLQNSQLRVSLGANDVIRGSDGTLLLKWRITFKKPFVGAKSLWSRAEDLGKMSAGFLKSGEIVLGEISSPNSAAAASASASASSANSF